jgi:hypothetical protein
VTISRTGYKEEFEEGEKTRGKRDTLTKQENKKLV